MITSMGRRSFGVVLVFCLFTIQAAAQSRLEIAELASYRLSDQVFTQFKDASNRISTVTRDNAAFTSDPLFTRDVTILGDPPALAETLETRLQKEPALADALRVSGMSAREFTKFALA